jgi:hypothetical protein
VSAVFVYICQSFQNRNKNIVNQHDDQISTKLLTICRQRWKRSWNFLYKSIFYINEHQYSIFPFIIPINVNNFYRTFIFSMKSIGFWLCLTVSSENFCRYVKLSALISNRQRLIAETTLSKTYSENIFRSVVIEECSQKDC